MKKAPLVMSTVKPILTLCVLPRSSPRHMMNFSTVSKRKRKGKPLKKSKSLRAIITSSRSPSSKSKSPLTPISKIITSPKFQDKMKTKLLDFQKEMQELFLPQFFKDTKRFQRFHEAKSKGLVMDAKWWTWNLLVALVPGAIVALVCEWHREEMETYYREQHIKEMKKLNGPDWELPPEDDISKGGKKQGASLSLFSPGEGGSSLGMKSDMSPTSYYTIVSNAVLEIIGFREPALDNDEDEQSLIETPSNSTGKDNLPPGSSVTQNISDEAEEPTNRPSWNEERVVLSAHASNTPKPTLEELMLRIEELENKLGHKSELHHNYAQAEGIPGMNEEKRPQSGIKNRVDQRRRSYYEKDEVNLSIRNEQKKDEFVDREGSQKVNMNLESLKIGVKEQMDRKWNEMLENADGWKQYLFDQMPRSGSNITCSTDISGALGSVFHGNESEGTTSEIMLKGSDGDISTQSDGGIMDSHSIENENPSLKETTSPEPKTQLNDKEDNSETDTDRVGKKLGVWKRVVHLFSTKPKPSTS